MVRYDEGLLVGYRHYDRAAIDPQFCFGHGLSYTRFEYGELEVEAQDAAHVRVTLEVTNAGARRGRVTTESAPGASQPRSQRSC